MLACWWVKFSGAGGTILLVLLPLLGLTRAQKGDTTIGVTAVCRDLFSCAIRKNCVHMKKIEETFENATITTRLYNDMDKAIDYGCIFTSGCLEECNRCPLCQSSKQQLVDVLSGSRRNIGDECSVLVQCSIACVESAQNDFSKINYCLRHKCAFHCFDGSCPKCSAFTTRIFNQICISGELRRRVRDWKGHCYEMFKGIVLAKFQKEFDKVGRLPSIGQKTHAPSSHAATSQSHAPQARAPESKVLTVHSGDAGRKK